MKYKMIVSDFDGTLFRADHTISDATIAAIKDYRTAGGKFFIATGRLYQAIKPHADRLELVDEVITYQGSGIYHLATGELLMADYIDCKLAEQIYQTLYVDFDECAVPILFHEDKCIVKCENRHITAFADVVKISLEYTGVDLNKYVADNNISPSKILAMIVPERADEILSLLIAKYGQVVNINRSTQFLVEIVNINSSKGNAVKWLGEKYGIKQEEIICIGDAENDNSMIIYAGLGVAMGNGMDSTKACADLICATCENDGVAQVIRQFALKE